MAEIEIESIGVDQIICLGDLLTLGPDPLAVLERLDRLGCPCILGNHDEFMFNPELVTTYTKAPALIEAIDWCRDRLSHDVIDAIAGFPRTLDVPLDDGHNMLLFHGTPDSNTTDLLVTTPPEVVDEMLSGRTATIMAGGHTHLQMLRQHRGRLLVNAGSIGMPFETYTGGGPPVVLPHAEYAIVESRPGLLTVQLQRVALDKAALHRAAARAADNPICATLARMYQ